tara:strand:- start:981 stop:1964 length:984 start_codon:yes stop_codon:yes gene_type:complete
MAYTEEEEEGKASSAPSGPLPISEITDLAGRGITILDKSRNFTYRDLLGVKKDPVYATKKTTIDITYNTEKIPTPSVNNVASLVSGSFSFNKPKEVINEVTNEITYSTGEDNFITSGGISTNLNVGGDLGTHYSIVVKDITNTKWYNWDTEEFENGYHEKCGHCGDGTLPLNIPPQTAETTYNIFFVKSGSTIYDSSLPTEKSPWVIKQLANVTTTFKIGEEKGFISDQVTTKTHLPEAVLDAGSINDGKIPITITTIPVRGAISLKKSLVETEDISAQDENTVILDSDLTASVSGRVGTITGTITIGKSSRRDTDITIQPGQFFTI